MAFVDMTEIVPKMKKHVHLTLIGKQFNRRVIFTFRLLIHESFLIRSFQLLHVHLNFALTKQSAACFLFYSSKLKTEVM